MIQRIAPTPEGEWGNSVPDGWKQAGLPPGTKRVAIEAAHPMSWHRWVGGDGIIIGIDHFGASAPFADIYKGLGLTVDKLVEAARGLLAR